MNEINKRKHKTYHWHVAQVSQNVVSTIMCVLKSSIWFSDSNYCYLLFGLQIRKKNNLNIFMTCQLASLSRLMYVMWWIKWSWKIIIVLFIYSIQTYYNHISAMYRCPHPTCFIYASSHKERMNRWIDRHSCITHLLCLLEKKLA